MKTLDAPDNTSLLIKVYHRNLTDYIQCVLVPYAVAQGSKNPDKLYLAYGKLIKSSLGLEGVSRDNLTGKYQIAYARPNLL